MSLEKKDLDGIYVRVERDGAWTNRCFSDLTDEEQERFMDRVGLDGTRRIFETMVEQRACLMGCLNDFQSLADATKREARLLREMADIYGIKRGEWQWERTE